MLLWYRVKLSFLKIRWIENNPFPCLTYDRYIVNFKYLKYS